MSTSGVATFNPDLTEIVEEAFERCGGELRTGYDLRTARRSMNFMFTDWANRGINMWTMEEGQQILTPGTATYTLPTDTVDLLDHVIRTNAGNTSTQADLTITRISESTYATLPNKLQEARPIQVWIQRLNTPQFTVWPVPDNSTTYTFVYWRLRRIQDAGSGTNTMDMPFRFYNAMERLQVLKTQYDEAWQLAAGEDQEKAPIRFVPRQQFIGSTY